MSFPLVKKIGTVNGAPWIAKVPFPVSHCKVVAMPSASPPPSSSSSASQQQQPSLQNIQSTVKMIKTCDLNLNLESEEDGVEINMAIVQALGREEWISLREHEIYILIWATCTEQLTTDLISLSFMLEDLAAHAVRHAFDAQFAVSQFSVDCKELDFGDCSSLDQQQIVREFTIKNLRDTKLQYRLDIFREDESGGGVAYEVYPARPQLTLAWYETGEAIAIGSSQTLLGKSFARIHATLRSPSTLSPPSPSLLLTATPLATQQQRFQWIICIENERNSENVSNIQIVATRSNTISSSSSSSGGGANLATPTSTSMHLTPVASVAGGLTTGASSHHQQQQAQSQLQASAISLQSASMGAGGASTSAAATAMLEVLQEHSRLPLALLGFGDDCVVGNVVSRCVILKNAGTVALEVSLSSPDSNMLGPVSMTGIEVSAGEEEEEGGYSDNDSEQNGNHANLDMSPPPPSRTPLTQEDLEEMRTLSPLPHMDDFPESFSRVASSSHLGITAPVTASSSPLTSGMPATLLRTKSDTILSGGQAPPLLLHQQHSLVPSASHQQQPAQPQPLSHLALANINLSVPAGTFIRLLPGEERKVNVHYLPQGPNVPNLGTKSSISFRLVFSCTVMKHLAQQLQVFKRQVQAECKACVSLFAVSPTLIKFGDCLLNQTKTATLVFTNLSEVETIVRARFESSVVRVDPSIISIEPKGKATATLVFLPKRINPRYFKEFTCTNVKNRKNTVGVRVESHNIDMDSFPYHSYFYNLFAFNAQGLEEDFTNWPVFFGPTLLDGVNARRIGIRNLTKRELTLNFKCSTDELQVLTFVDGGSSKDAEQEFARVMEDFEAGRLSRPGVHPLPPSQHHVPVDKLVEQRLNYLQSKMRKVSSVLLPPESENKLVILVLVFRPSSAKRALVTGALKFESSLSLQIDLPNLLAEDLKALQDALLWNLGDKSPSGGNVRSSASEETIGKLPPSSSFLARSTSSTALQLQDQEQQQLLLPFRNPRIMRLRTTIAKAEMTVSQSHFNHGLVDNSWERRPFKILLMNHSGEALVFKIDRKSRELLPLKPGDQIQQQQQVSSSCVEIEDAKYCGVIPAYSSETINLLFVPKIWAGRVKETFLIRNVMVPSSTVEIVVKAVVSLPEHFRVEHDELDFGPIFPGMTGETAQLITLYNTSEKTRDLTVQVSKENSERWPKAHLAVFCFYVYPPQIEGAPMASTTVQEQIEELEFKIRLAVRKNDTEKISVLNRKLLALQAQQEPKEQQQNSSARSGLVFGPLKGSRRVVLPPKSSVQVAMKLHVRLMASFATYKGQAFHSVKVFETHEEYKGPMKHIPFLCQLFADRQSFFRATTPRSTSLGGNGSPGAAVNSPFAMPSPFIQQQQEQPVHVHDLVPFNLNMSSPPSPLPPSAEPLPIIPAAALPIKQIDVGARNLNTWFTFILPRAGDMEFATPPPSPGVATSKQALSKFRIVFADEKQQSLIEFRPVLVESYRQLSIEARFIKGGRHAVQMAVESIETAERHEVLVKGQASFLEMLPSALDFGNLIVVPEEPTKPNQAYFSAKPLVKFHQTFTVRNTHREPVFVSAESNSSFFVLYLSQDESRIDRMMLEPGQEMRMFVAIKPALLADAWRGVCRLWKGGIVVTCEVGSEDDRDTETHHVARFQSLLSLTANVGMSLLAVREQRVAGTLTVRNDSEKIPLRIECSALEEDIVFSRASKLEIPPLSEADVVFFTVKQESALHFCTIVVSNTDSGEVKRIPNVACVFKSDMLRLERTLDFRVAVPVRRKNDLYVVAHDAVGADPVRVRNMTANRLRVTMSCRLFSASPPALATPGAGASAAAAIGAAVVAPQQQDPPLIGGAGVFSITSATTGSAATAQGGGMKDFVPRAQCVLGPGAFKDIVYRFPRDSRLLPDSFQGWLAFELRIGELATVVAAVRFRGEARISQFEVAGGIRPISAGEVGTANGWRKEITLCKLFNPDRFVPSEVEISISSPTKHLILTPLNPRLFLEPGSIEHPVVMRIQALSTSFAEVTEVEAVLTLSNVLNEANEFTVPVKVRICPKRFYLEKEGGESFSSLLLPAVLELREDEGTSVVNDWVAVRNPSLLAEAVIETHVTLLHASEATLSIVFRATGAPVPSSFVVKPQERVGIRVILRLERGCSLRGEHIDFGLIKFICGKEERVLKMVGKISPAIPLWRAAGYENSGNNTGVLVLQRGETFSITLVNETKLGFTVKLAISNPDLSYYSRVCTLLSFAEGVTGGALSVERKPSDTIIMAPFGAVTFTLLTLQRFGKAKIKFTASLKEFPPIELDVSVSKLALGSEMDGPSGMPASSLSSSSSQERPFIITGCSLVCEPGLYEIDAGLLTEEQTWRISLQTESVDWFVVRGMGKNAGGVAEDWITVRCLHHHQAQAQTFDITLNPQMLTQMGGFFSAYLVFPRLGVVRIKMEVVMVIPLDELQQQQQQPNLLVPSPSSSTANLTSSGSGTAATPGFPQAMLFELSPSSAIVSGPLIAGRTRSFPFTLFNRHARAPLVFQLNVVGVRGGLTAWFSLLGCASEEHRRVTVNSSSSCRLQLNLYVPPVTAVAPGTAQQTEDFADLEINVSCRQLRNSILILKVCLPPRGTQSAFALSCSSTVRVGEPITLALAPGYHEGEVIAVGPDWIKTAPSVGSTSLVRCRLSLGSGSGGDSLTVVECACPGLLTFYNAREAHDYVTVKVVPSPSCAAGTNSSNAVAFVNPSPQGASVWRDAIELEMVKACISGTGGGAAGFLELGGILFRELLELILTDAGGRGASLVALFFKLQFGGEMNETALAQKELYIKELRSVPESLLLNVADL